MGLKKIFYLKNEVMNYQWGSKTAIAKLLGEPFPSTEPQAELWMGAHPKAPSKVKVNHHWVLLSDLIHENPEAVLGTKTVKWFGKRLPFLFKVLAADEPLSIQAHPEQSLAIKGYHRENEQKVPSHYPSRNYKDDRSKPECVCALTPFTALCGFRKIDEILQFFKNTEDKNFASLKNTLKKDQDGRLSVEEGLKTFFKSLMEADENLKKELIRTMITSARKNNNPDPALEWMMRIQAIEKFKNDIGVFAPLFLNLVVLNPGEALFLPPGRLHAYLEGTAIEIMANSDNTLRGGLTQKHIDLTELLKVVRFEETKIGIINPPKNLECIYKTPAREFMLSRIHIDQERPYYRTDRKSIEIALCTEGTVVISCTDNHQPLTIKKGDSVLIPAVVDSYRMTGSAVIYKAGVGR